MKKNKKYKYLLYTIITFIFLIYLNYSLYKKEELNIIERTIKDASTSIINLITPKVEVDYKNINNVINNDILNELQELKNILNLNNNVTYKLEHAYILNRNVDTYFNEILINKGEDNGIKKDMIAINQNGIIGKVNYVTNNTATIKLLTSNELKISVQIGKYNGIITGYENGYIIANPIKNNVEILNDSEVITNGLGKLYPKGIKIGNVVEVIDEGNDINKIIKIKSNVDYSDIKYVSIIIGDK